MPCSGRRGRGKATYAPMLQIVPDPGSRKTQAPDPVVYLVLILPFGVMSGSLTVAVVYLLTQAGVGIEQSAELVALSYVPHTWKFLWAPIADTTLTRKRWYVFSALVTAVGIYVTGAVPADESSLPLLTAVVLISNLAVTFLAMAVESLMAYDAPDDAKGRAGGWFQAGNLGGMGLGGGAGLWMTQNIPPPWIGSAALGATCLLCCLALMFVAEPPSTLRMETYRKTITGLLKDLWQVARSRRGFLGLLICFLPIGTGATSNPCSAVAGAWTASGPQCALG